MTEKIFDQHFYWRIDGLKVIKFSMEMQMTSQVTFSYENDKQQILLILAVIFKSSLQKSSKQAYNH